jgi:hypothetical protein
LWLTKKKLVFLLYLDKLALSIAALSLLAALAALAFSAFFADDLRFFGVVRREVILRLKLSV